MKLAVLVLKYSGGGSNPDAAIFCPGDRGGRGGGGRIGKNFFSSNRRMPLLVRIEEATVVPYRQAEDGVCYGIVAEAARCILHEPVGGADPEGAGGILRDTAGVAAGEGGGVFVVEDFEVDPIERATAVFRCDPDVAVFRLEDLVDAVLRKPVLCRPGLVAEVVDVLRGGGEGDDSAE